MLKLERILPTARSMREIAECRGCGEIRSLTEDRVAAIHETIRHELWRAVRCGKFDVISNVGIASVH